MESERFLDYNQDIMTLQQDYELYHILLNKLNKEVVAMENSDEESKAIWLKRFVNEVERLNNYLHTVNSRIKHIESCQYSNSQNYEQIKDIKIKAAKQYESFNTKFLEVVTMKNKKNKEEKSQNKPKSLVKDMKSMRYEDLELLLKISNETMKISKDMKNSVIRADGSINTIESNVLVVKDQLRNADKETLTYYQNNNSNLSKYIFYSFLCILIVIVLLIVYYKF